MKKTRMGPRPFKLKKSALPHAEGSCLVTMGLTQVLCAATVEDKAPDHARDKGTGWVTAEYAMLPRSGEKRTNRHRAMSGGRAQEISRLVGRALRASVHLADLAPYSIVIDCDVIRADGGTRTAAINGGFVAMAQALQTLWKQGKLARWPLRRYVGAVSVGMVKGQPVVDMRYEEDKQADIDLNVVLTERNEIVEIQAAAEGAPLLEAQLHGMLRFAKTSVTRIIQTQKKILGRLGPA